MHTFIRTLFAFMTAGAIFVVGISTVTAGERPFLPVGEGHTSTPIGHAEFCAKRPEECQTHSRPVEAIALNQNRWNQLLQVNAYYNETIVPISDQNLYDVDEFWTYPNGYGDCEDFVLAKRRALIEAGWPESTLLMTVVRELDGEGHAVLLVRTDRGDFVLDNQDGLIKLWSQTPYQFIKRQDHADAAKWVDTLDDRSMMVANARN